MKPVASAGALALVCLSAILAAAACSSDHAGPVEPAGPTFSAPMSISLGHTIGTPAYAQGDSSVGGLGQAVQGVECDTTTAVVHVHAHLTLIADGTQRAIPLAVGTPDPFILDSLVLAAACFYWLHTHDATGIIHLEAPNSSTLTLGNFFAIWGQPLSRSNVGGFTGDVTAWVDSTRYDGDLTAIPITAHENITLVVGAVPAELPLYSFPAGY